MFKSRKRGSAAKSGVFAMTSASCGHPGRASWWKVALARLGFGLDMLLAESERSSISGEDWDERGSFTAVDPEDAEVGLDACRWASSIVVNVIQKDRKVRPGRK